MGAQPSPTDPDQVRKIRPKGAEEPMRTAYVIHMRALMGPRSVSCNCFSLTDLETNLRYALSNGYSVVSVEKVVDI